MKKLISILLTLALILSFSATAFATTLVIADDAVERTYNGYKLLDLTTSLKADGDHPADCDKVNHSDDCYNYAYTVNEKYEAILQSVAGENKGILEFLSELSSDVGSEYGTLRNVADDIFKAIQEAKIAPDATGLDGDNDTIEQGYWLFADVTGLDGENEANSLVIVDTAGQDPVTINPKTDLPTVEKKVKDINDSADNDIKDNAWQDSADHDITDIVPFKLTATLPSNLAYYDAYQIAFHDILSDGLTLNPGSVKVYMYNTKAEADADTELDGFAKDVTGNFVVTTEGLTDGCTFEVSCGNVKAIEGVNKDTVFVVYYEATLNENAVIGATGNPNEVYLEFSNNPYTDGTGETEKDKVVVFTYKLIINKTDAEGNALAGAGFTLYKKDTTGTYVAIGEELVGEALTTFTWEGLDDGDYKLEETTVPAGYNKMAAIEFTITAAHDEVSEDPTLTSLDGGVLDTGNVEIGAIEKDIVNNTGTVLPETGAEGTLMLITISTMLVIVACVFMITRKKMSIYED